MAWQKEPAETDEELQETLQTPPKRAYPRWAWLGLATAILGLVGVGLSQMGALQLSRRHSVLAHMSKVHRKIDAIIAAAVAKDFTTKIEFLVDAYADRGTPPSAMGIHVHMKVGEEESPPFVIAVNFAAKSGQGAKLKKKLEDIFEAALTAAPEEERGDIRKAVQFSAAGDDVALQVTPPDEGDVKQEEEDLKAAFKLHKPEFHGHIGLGSSFEDMYAGKDESLVAAPKGVEVRLEAGVANSLFEALADMDCPETQTMAGYLKLLRLVKSRDEVYYGSEEELASAFGRRLPTLNNALQQMCAGVPGEVSASLKGLDQELAGLKSAAVRGLPYDWELDFDMQSMNPVPFLQHCVTNS